MSFWSAAMPAPGCCAPACCARVGSAAARQQNMVSDRPTVRISSAFPAARRRLFRRLQRRFARFPPCFLDFSGLLFDQLDEMVDDIGVFQPVVGEAADIDLMGPVAAAGKAD